MMSVRAAGMGGFVGAAEGREWDRCPGCGGFKRRSSEFCGRCRAEQQAAEAAAVWREVDWPGMRDRHRRFTAGILAGMGVRELMGLAREGRLPTWEELVARDAGAVIRVWWDGGV